jgi:membrane associated rhomboid family serine protease
VSSDLARPPESVRLRNGRSISLHDTGLRHPSFSIWQGEAWSAFRDVTHVALSSAFLRLGTRRSVYLIPRRAFVEPDGAERLARRILDRIAALPGGAERIARMAALEEQARRRVPLRASTGLALLCVVLWVAEKLYFGPAVMQLGSFVGDLVAYEPWRLVTANWLHADWPLWLSVAHLLLNTLSLVALGALVERPLGAPRCFFVLCASGLAAMGGCWLAGNAEVVGASGIVFGLAGAALHLELRCPERLPAHWRVPRNLFVAALAIDLVGLSMIPIVAWAGHVGGFVGGGLAAALVARGGVLRRGLPLWLYATNVLAGAVAIAAAIAAWLPLFDGGDALASRAARLEAREGGVAPFLLNNYAWFILTTGRPKPHNVEAAVRLAESAVEGTERRDPNCLDTLAEALFAAGEPERAVDVIDEAIALAPRVEYFREQRRRFLGERAAEDRPRPPPFVPIPEGPGRPPPGQEEEEPNFTV